MSPLEITLFSSLMAGIVGFYIAVILLLRRNLKQVTPARPWVPGEFLFAAFIPALGVPIAIFYHGVLLVRLFRLSRERGFFFPLPAWAISGTLGWVCVGIAMVRPNPAIALSALVGLGFLAFSMWRLGGHMKTLMAQSP